MYCINLPQFETYISVNKDIFFELVDRLSMKYLIVKDFEDEYTHYFAKISEQCYEYIGCIKV